jgi:restriction endonuclease S subunit
MISGSAQPQITKSDVERFKIALIPVNFQVEITRKMDNFWQINENVESKIATSKALQKSLINQIF